MGDAVQGTVAAVVVTFNRAELLRDCLMALDKQKRPVDEVIVVDNDSTDGTAQMLALEFPHVRHLRMPRNDGPAGGFAVGMAAGASAGHRWLWVFNDDDRPEPEALEVLLDTARTLPQERLGMLATWLRSDEGEILPHGRAWRHKHVELAVNSVGGPLQLADVLIFAGTLINTRLVRDVGVPDADYFMMCEELEYCLRARAADWLIYVIPNPLTVTLHEGALTEAGWRAYYQTRNQLAMSLGRRSIPELYWWAVKQGKFVAAILLWGDRKRERLRLRALGAWHGVRGVRGKTIDPASQP